ncbi:transposase [Natronorubrum texcoconense]|uniref:Transposase DDE domain-containing protein n=1 Tax=Natronorubrum texcoconense TaxID=1095776 RepID=A0A1G8V9C3_9EURY|nr:transposase [Natronorubrum texcoconense]SDJ62457.1 hypothetical protein SAMN04515672_1224 [Natronorubrum texcoconense]
MNGSDTGSSDSLSEVADDLVTQAEDLCRIHDHITRVIADLELPEDGFKDPFTTSRYEFEPMLRVLLYMEASGFSQAETQQRLEHWPFLQVRFGLNGAPRQQTISHNVRNRLSRRGRQALKTAAEKIREIAADHDLVSAPDEGPTIDPNEMGEKGLTEAEILRAVRVARDRVFTEFVTERAPNAKYEDEVFWELQGYLSMTASGKRKMKRRSARFSWRGETPHGDTHTRTIKKLGAPDPQTSLSEFSDATTPKNWKRIRKTLLDPFDAAIENLIEGTDFGDALREPVNVAIDVTPWVFYPSPWKNRDLEIPKEDYPEMVSGLKDEHARGYKFATLTVIGKNTPIVLAIEPVKENSDWESDTAESIKKAAVVERLLAKAQEYVDIHKVMADREFSTHTVRDVIDRNGLTYLIPKPAQADQDLENIEKVKTHPDADVGVVNDVLLTVDGRTHGVDFMYVPSREETGSYAIFTTNADVPPDRIQGLTAQYRDRWMIENEYKSIKKHFLPTTASTDYRVRLFYFVAGVLMYNVWRLTNLLLRSWVDVHHGESPPVPAGEITEILLLCLGPDGIG